jgi:hypothetical protein
MLTPKIEREMLRPTDDPLAFEPSDVIRAVAKLSQDRGAVGAVTSVLHSERTCSSR